ncbi:protoheme IX farnesyltransferase [Rhizobium sp. LC145]|nr:protoheme IX farnesyltransferase [Rhizobium sp. LC145]
MDTVKLNDAQRKSRRNRNVALGVVLAALVVLFYVITLVKIGGLGN